MNELQRQAYIEAMGVECYIPRLVLPGAKPSVACEMPELAVQPTLHELAISEHVAQPQTPLDARVRRTGSAAAMQALFGDTPNKTDKPSGKKRNEHTQPDIPPVLQTNTQKIPSFALTIVRGASLLIIDEGLSANIAPQDYSTLVQNIVFALGETVDQLTLDPFIWPMVKNNSIDQTESAARQALEAFLAKQVSQQKKPFVIVMGDTAAHYLNGQSGNLIPHDQIQAQIIYTASAAKSLIDSSLKQQIWHDLQPLLSQL